MKKNTPSGVFMEKKKIYKKLIIFVQFGINLMIFGYWRVYAIFGNLRVKV
jgi:hypothetical protein